jgi:hypothetical protein
MLYGICGVAGSGKFKNRPYEFAAFFRIALPLAVAQKSYAAGILY